ncbi:MAG: hypothetical protein P8J61_03410 [Gammaproteobacteria bacterium]|jgi:hypothetical protein|nr:hypothetical protein [Gammaproteobacteria bacterium]
MEFLQPTFDWLGASWLGVASREVSWIFVAAETAHFIGLSILFGSLLVIDLRVVGFARFINMKAAMKFIPIAMVGFAINLLSGITFIASNPERYGPNIAFQWKMGLVLIAGLNALWFYFGEHKELSQLADGEDADFRAKVIGGLSLIIWVVVIILGRFMPFVE